MERRITVRLLAYWEKLRKSRPMPAVEELSSADIGDLWDYCFLLHVKDMGKPGYNYTYLGPAISEVYRGGLSQSEADGLVSPHISTLSTAYTQLIDTLKPVIDEGEFQNLNGQTVKYRQCLLPLGEGGEVQAIFGGMRCRIYKAGQ